MYSLKIVMVRDSREFHNYYQHFFCLLLFLFALCPFFFNFLVGVGGVGG